MGKDGEGRIEEGRGWRGEERGRREEGGTRGEEDWGDGEMVGERAIRTLLMSKVICWLGRVLISKRPIAKAVFLISLKKTSKY